MAASLVRLADLTGDGPTQRSFTAAVQHVAGPRRMRVASRVASFHVVHLADPTRSFFKLLVWGDTLPTFHRDDHDDFGDDIAAIRVGDIALFTACTVKVFRGNVEAQFTRHSRVQLLYRRDRYFNTRDVRLKDLFPMIEWYKTQRHTFLVEPKASTSTIGLPFTPIRELREDMLVNLRGSIHECKQSERDITATRVLPDSSEFDGVQLHEVTMEDASTHTLVLNLWDEYADPRFVTRILSHRGNVEVLGVVVSYNHLAKRLLANTTPRTEFRFINDNMMLTDSEGDGEVLRREHTFTTVEALDNASLRDGASVVLQDVVIEHVVLDHFLGKADRVEAALTPMLVESACTVCDQTLPFVGATTIPQLFSSCKNQCRVKTGKNTRRWRYRTIQVVLRDSKDGRINVKIGDLVLTRVLGNVAAELLVHPRGPTGVPLAFNPRSAVASLINSLTDDNQRYEVELHRMRMQNDHDRRASLLHMDDSVRDDEDNDENAQAYTVISIAATIDSPW